LKDLECEYIGVDDAEEFYGDDMLDLGCQNFGVMRLFIATTQWICRGLHHLEGELFAIMNRNVDGFRQVWTANYLFDLKKREDRL